MKRQFGQLVEKDEEGEVKGSLGKLRAALTMYAKQHNGVYPLRLDSLIPKYLPKVPAVTLPYWKTPYITATHVGPMQITYFRTFAPDDRGTWGYVNQRNDNRFGLVFVNCTHRTWRGSRWCDE